MTVSVKGSTSDHQADSIWPGVKSLRHRLELSPSVWIIAILGLFVLVFAVTLGSRFFSVPNLRNILVDASILLVLAVGETFVTIAAGIDLSCGAILVFAGVLSGKVAAALSSPLMAAPAAIVVAIVAGALWGWLNGVLVAKAKLSAFIVTLGTLGMALGLAFVITHGVDQTTVPTWLINSVGVGNVFGIPWLAIISLAIALVFGILLWKTRFGLYTYAAGSNPEAARRTGIAIDRHLIKVYSLAGGLYGVAGFLNLAHFATTTIAGHDTDNLNAITAVVIGGTSLYGGVGTMLGTVFGNLIPAVMQNGLVIMGVQSYWLQVAVGAVLIIAVLLDQLRRRQR